MASEPPRRTWLRFAGRIIGRLHPGGAEAGAWRQAGRVRARVNPPTFPNRTFDILEFGAGHFLRPSFVQPYRCRNVVISGVTILRSPMWEIHPVLSQNVTVRHGRRRRTG